MYRVVLFTPSRETIPEVLVKINSVSFLLFLKWRMVSEGLEIFVYDHRVIPPCHSFVHSACRMSFKRVYFFNQKKESSDYPVNSIQKVNYIKGSTTS